MLDAVERRVGHAVEVLDGVDAELDVIGGSRFLHRNVRRSPQPELVRFVHDCFELIAVHADDLETVGAALFDVADPRPDLGRRPRLALAHEGIDQNSRCHDRVRVAFRLPPLRFIEVAADFAGGGDAGGQVQVTLVLNWLWNAGLPLLVPMHVHVDDARHHVLAGRIDQRVGRRARCKRAARRRGTDVRDAAVLDDDVHRTVRRLRVAVDHHRVLDDETPGRLRVGRRRGRGLRSVRRAGGRAEHQQKGAREARQDSTAIDRHRHAVGSPIRRIRVAHALGSNHSI